MSVVADLPAKQRGPSLSDRRARLSQIASRHRSWSILVGMIIVGVGLPLIVQFPPFTLAQTPNAWIDGFTNAGVFVLLAMGLNLVVGVAGLLDLGYAAFFAIGAYTYAYVASPFGNSILGIDILGALGGPNNAGIIFWPMLLVGAGVAALFGILLGAPTLRLRGDYLAIVTLGFGEIVPLVFLNSDKVTNGTNGIGGLARPALPDHGRLLGHRPVALLRHRPVPRDDRDDVLLPAHREPARQGVGGDPRGRARRGGKRHQHRRRPSCSPSRSAPRPRASPACSTPRSS